MIENKPSKTAEFVVKGVYAAAESLKQKGDKCNNNELVEQNKKVVESLFPALKNTLYKTLFLWRMNFLDRFTVRGFCRHFIARKSEIFSHVEKGIKDGCEQVVIIGAGYDPLSLVLNKRYSHVNFVEIDFPATQKRKINKLSHLYQGANNVSFASHDIEKLSLEMVMEQHPTFVKGIKTMFVCEGVTMYLSETAIDELLKALVTVASSGSYFVFTFMDKENNSIDFRNQFPVMRWYLKLKGEKFTWGIDEDKLAGFLCKRNYELLLVANEKSMKQHFSLSQNIHLAVGEKVAVAMIITAH